MPLKMIGRSTRLALSVAGMIAVTCTPAWASSGRGVAPDAVPSFTIRGIGPASASAVYIPAGINGSSVVAGTRTAPTVESFLFSKGKIFGVHPPKDMAASEIFGLNDANRVVGEGCTSAGCSTTRAYTGQIRKHRVSWRKLPPPSGSSLCGAAGCSSVADGAGANGDLTGWFAQQAVIWLSGAGGYTAKRLSYTATRFTSSSGRAIDSSGDVVGVESGQVTVGVLWPRHGKPVLLPSCGEFLVRGGATFEYPFSLLSKGSGKNRTLRIVGKCLVESPTTHQTGFAPCFWNATISVGSVTVSDPVRLDATDGSDGGRAAAINTKGWIVGNQGDAASTPTLWINRHPYVLKALIPAASGWTLDVPYAMNAKGQIVGIGTFNGQARTFLLTPR
jgi:hypothetical protein